MALKKDKQKVLGEVFDDERVKSFLEAQPADDIAADFHVLEKAYRGMNTDNFATLVNFFVAAGRNLNATDNTGQTLYAQISQHREGAEYAEILKNAGAH